MATFQNCASRMRRLPLDSHRFIALHWCIDAFCRTTGEAFSVAFERVGQQLQFGRHPSRWPDKTQMLSAVDLLDREREVFRARRQALISERRHAKALGRRLPKRGELDRLEQAIAAQGSRRKEYFSRRKAARRRVAGVTGVSISQLNRLIDELLKKER